MCTQTWLPPVTFSIHAGICILEHIQDGLLRTCIGGRCLRHHCEGHALIKGPQSLHVSNRRNRIKTLGCCRRTQAGAAWTQPSTAAGG